MEKFLTNALNQDIEIRIRLATYFANVSALTYKQGWAAYLKELVKLRDGIRKDINDKEKELHEKQQIAGPGDQVIAEILRDLHWKYGELNYAEPDRNVLSDPRATPSTHTPNALAGETVFDTPASITDIVADCLAKSGIKAVGRYYAKSPWKILKQEEMKTLAKFGIQVIPVYEDNPTSASYFSFERGKEDADRAFNHARNEAKQPTGTVVFFTVDYNATASDVDSMIMSYCEGVNAAKSNDALNQYRIGVYGSGLVIDRLRAAGLIEKGWLASPRGWSGTANVASGSSWDLMQTGSRTMCNLEGGISKANPQLSVGDYSFTLAKTP